ncbi:hypothetical protein L218DRAFT_1007533 [Marasmius fiardii PR-910]|nr:hypothetical protein L218DRAFT_1007533 [Marasmius fiardii PR-910]
MPSMLAQVPKPFSVPTSSTFAFSHCKHLFSHEESFALQQLQKEHFELKLQCQGIRRSHALIKKRTHEAIKKKLAKAFVPKKIQVIHLPPQITLPNTMSTTNQNPQQGEPHASQLHENCQFKGTSSSDWLEFLDDLEDIFIQFGITYEEVKIYKVIVCMNLCEEDLKDGWVFDNQQGSEEELWRMIDEYQIMPLNMTEVRFKMFIWKFRLESKKLEKPLALLSNKTLVEHFLSAFEDKFVEKIINGLNQAKRLRMELDQAEGIDEECRKQDP